MKIGPAERVEERVAGADGWCDFAIAPGPHHREAVLLQLRPFPIDVVAIRTPRRARRDGVEARRIAGREAGQHAGGVGGHGVVVRARSGLCRRRRTAACGRPRRRAGQQHQRPRHQGRPRRSAVRRTSRRCDPRARPCSFHDVSSRRDGGRAGATSVTRSAGGLRRLRLDSPPWLSQSQPTCSQVRCWSPRYEAGYFPMAMDDGEIRWYSPDPRGVLPLDRFHAPRRLLRVVRSRRFEISVDRAFRDVMAGVRGRSRRRDLDQRGDSRQLLRPSRARPRALGRGLGRRRPGGRPVRRVAQRRVLRRVDVPPRERRVEGGAVGPGRAPARPGVHAARHPVADAVSRVRAAPWRSRGIEYLEALAEALDERDARFDARTAGTRDAEEDGMPCAPCIT